MGIVILPEHSRALAAISFAGAISELFETLAESPIEWHCQLSAPIGSDFVIQSVRRDGTTLTVEMYDLRGEQNRTFTLLVECTGATQMTE